MNMLARSCWITAPLYALGGMGFGIWMSVTTQFQYAPAHAHLNLLGWVSMALFGAYYSIFPNAATSMLAKVQVGLMHLGAILMFPGVIMAVNQAGDGLAKAGSSLAILSMLLFAYIAATTSGRQ